MPRLPRVYIEKVLYYVTSKSGHNQTLFTDHNDYESYTSMIDSYKRQYGFRLFSYVLMPTHLHMLIELRNNIPISNIMHDLNSLYTKNYNSRYGKKGHLFQERFRALLAEKEPYLLPLTRYIHLNPKRAEIVDEPKKYPYCSHIQFLDVSKRRHPDISNEIEEVFGLLEGREKEFEEYVTKADPKEIRDFGKTMHKKRVLGSKGFEEKIKKTIYEIKKRQKRVVIPKKVRVMYVLFGGVIIGISTVIGGYFYLQSTKLKNTFDKTISMYDRTLEMLKRERDKALKANEDIEQYVWKIRLTEKALDDLKEERGEAVKAEKDIEGYAWSIQLQQVGGPGIFFNKTDIIILSENTLSSVNLKRAGFSDARYSKRELSGGNFIWETMQKNDRGETASWRGEWNGNTMRGILSMCSTDGTVRDFSFSSIGERIKK